jgi:hypothetical protein
MIASRRGHARATKRVRALAATALRRQRPQLAMFFLCVALAFAFHAQHALSDDTAQSATTDTTPIVVGLSDAKLTLPIPSGYCAIAPTAPDLASSFAAVEASFGKGTCLLAWFVDCETLASVRSGAAPVVSLFADYGVYVTPINDAGVYQQFPGIARTEFVRQIADTMPPFDRDRLSITVANLPAVPDKTDNGLRMATREIGLLSEDAQAYYLATAAELTLNDEQRALMGVAATTLVHRVAVSTILYGGSAGTGALGMLEARAQAATLALIGVNPGGDDSDRRFAFDANRLALIGFAIGLLFIAIGLVNLAWRYWCRRYGLRP